MGGTGNLFDLIVGDFVLELIRNSWNYNICSYQSSAIGGAISLDRSIIMQIYPAKVATFIFVFVITLILFSFFESEHYHAHLSDRSSNFSVCKLSANLLRVATSTTRPSFDMAVLRNDKVVSKHILEFGLWDVHVLDALQFILTQNPCENGKSIVLDVGANVGFFGLYAMARNCSVAFFEPQNGAGDAIEWSLCMMSRMNHRAQLIRQPVLNKSAVLFPDMADEKHFNTGSLGFDWCSKPKARCKARPAAHLDNYMLGSSASRPNVIGDSIIVMKIDVEGFEMDVLKTATRLMETRAIKNILLELTPNIVRVEENSRMLRTLLANGFQLAEILRVTKPIADTSKPFLSRVRPVRSVDIETLLRGNQTDLWASQDDSSFEHYNALIRNFENHLL